MTKLQLFIRGADYETQVVEWEGAKGSVDLQEVTGLEGAEGTTVVIGGIQAGEYLGILEVRKGEREGDDCFLNQLLAHKPCFTYQYDINSVRTSAVCSTASWLMLTVGKHCVNVGSNTVRARNLHTSTISPRINPQLALWQNTMCRQVLSRRSR